MGIILPEGIICWGKKKTNLNHQTTNKSWNHLQKPHSYNLVIHIIKKLKSLSLSNREQHQTITMHVWAQAHVHIPARAAQDHRAANWATGHMVLGKPWQMLQREGGSPSDWQRCEKPSNSSSEKSFASWKALNKRGTVIFGLKIVVLR